MAQILKHTLQCKCFAASEMDKETPQFYEFIAISEVDENGDVVPRTIPCDNCGRLHEVYEICKSNVIDGTDSPIGILSMEEIEMSIPEKLQKLLKDNKCPKHTWEEASLILEKELWGSSIILNRDIQNNKVFCKTLKILGVTFYRIDNSTSDLL